MPDFRVGAAYRFHSTPDEDTMPPTDHVYLTLTSTGQIMAAPLDLSSEMQKWKIVDRADQYFDIVNVGTGDVLCIAPPNGQEPEYTPNVYGSISTGWDIEWWSNDNSVVVKVPSDVGDVSLKALDLSLENRIVFWEQNDQSNQHWIWKPVDPIPPVQWMAVNNGVFPSGAIQGGNDTNRQPLYVTRAFLPESNSYHCGKGGPHLADKEYRCLIPYDGLERSCNKFETLVADSNALTWIACEGPSVDLSKIKDWNGRIMKPIQAGSDRGNPLYAIQTDVQGYTTPGKGSNDALWIGFGGKEETITGEFQILCYSTDYSS